MNPKIRLALMFTTIMAIGTVGTTATTIAFAEQPEDPGIEEADDNVHTNTGGLSKQDFAFHEGLCQGGISTEALNELGGCAILSPPGSSGEVRKDN